MAETNDKTAGQMGEELKNAVKLPNVQEFADAYERISSSARMVNNTFGQSRERIVELQTAIADTTPGILRMGGSFGDVSKSMQEIAEASKRNVVASSEDIEKLYASSKVLDMSVREISDAFLNVGVGIEQVGTQLEESVNYVRSIGGNTKQVMDSVRSNMDQMNRYQFEGGVQGLTKMAAQASMLRFDMSNTFALAEKVLDPEGAVNMASAFQRLGVSAGALADPFALMNASINDPSGLQDGLANISKQFTYFDEKTKTFKINPQGVLTLREMEKEAGLASGSLSKMGLAAAELDMRISDINKAGLTIASEEDKQYLANIATMQDGKYKVTLEDGTKKELAELTQPEFDKLIEQQKNAPKTMEDIAKSQLSYSESSAGDLKAIRSAIVGGAVTQRDLLKGGEAARNLSTNFTGAASENFSNPQKVRDTITESFGDIKQLFKDINNKDIKTTDAASMYLEKLGQQGLKIEEGFKQGMIKTLEETRKKTTGTTGVDEVAKEFLDKMLGGVKSEQIKGVKDGNKPISSLIEGTKASEVQQSVANNNPFAGGGGTSKVNVDGGFKIDVNFTGGASELTSAQKEQVTKMLIEKMNSAEMQQYMVSVTGKDNPTKAPSGKTVSR
jgi:hypothetical protein